MGRTYLDVFLYLAGLHDKIDFVSVILHQPQIYHGQRQMTSRSGKVLV